MVEKLLQLLVSEVDTNLFETVILLAKVGYKYVSPM
jgi:hypothetical protein